MSSFEIQFQSETKLVGYYDDKTSQFLCQVMAPLKVPAIPPGCNYFSCSPFNNAHILCQIS